MIAANLQAPFTGMRGQSEPPPPPDQTPDAPVQEPHDAPGNTPNAPVREPGPEEPKKYGSS